MKRLDKYLLAQFLKAFYGSLIFMIGLYVITIYIDNLKYFFHPNVPISLIAIYILNKIPYVLIQILPAAALFSTSFIFGNMNSSNEIIAIYNGRIGFSRLIAPFMITGILLALFSFFFFEFVSADCSNKAFEIRNNIKKLTGKSLSYMYSNTKYFFKGKDNTIYYVEVFDSDNDVMCKPVIFKFDSKGNMIFQLNASNGIFDQKEKKWKFENVNIIKFDENEKFSEEKYKKYSMKLHETPNSFIKTPQNVMQMRIKDALNFIKSKQKSGGNYKKYLVEFHWRFAFPFSVVITILIGSVAGIYFRKAVLVLSFFLAIIIYFGYVGMLSVGLAYGRSGKLNPVIAAWIANIIYFAAGIVALRLKR